MVLLRANVKGATYLHGGANSATNNQMELYAVICALEAIPVGEQGLVISDSQYVVKGSNEWRQGWERKGMRTAKGEPVANAELWQTLWALADKRAITFKWIRGHSGFLGNEAADMLACLGSYSAAQDVHTGMGGTLANKPSTSQGSSPQEVYLEGSKRAASASSRMPEDGPHQHPGFGCEPEPADGSILDELAWRGLISDCSNLEGLRQALCNQSFSLYCGFDPTASSLHVGSLIPLITMARFQRFGHRVLGLVGGATGLIGDPSGKSAERVLQTSVQVAAQALGIKAQIARFIDIRDCSKGAVVNNLEWTKPLSVLDFLRDYGKHFSINAMIQRDSVKSRLDREGEGISFTEFAYMILQAYDFKHLAKTQSCWLQIGGSDQWGNMCSGVDLIRRRLGKEAFALTLPLLTASDGSKFGKTAKGAVWLDPKLTTPFEFFQFWLNTADSDVIGWLKKFTFLTRAQIDEIEQDLKVNPGARLAQRTLAKEVTAIVHGLRMANQMEKAADLLFRPSSTAETDLGVLEESTWNLLSKSLTTVIFEDKGPVPLARALVDLGLVESKSQANAAIEAQGCVSVNGQSIKDASMDVFSLSWIHGNYLLVKKGKKSFALAKRTRAGA